MTLKEIATMVATSQGISTEEAMEAIRYTQQRIIEEGEDPEDIVAEELGLEPDYVIDLMLEGAL